MLVVRLKGTLIPRYICEIPSNSTQVLATKYEGHSRGEFPKYLNTFGGFSLYSLESQGLVPVSLNFEHVKNNWRDNVSFKIITK